MKINYEKIKAVFPVKAWAYAEGIDSVKIGKWNGNEFDFAEPFVEKHLSVLRVFDANRELKFAGDKCRDTGDYKEGDFIKELAESQYFIYGEQATEQGEYTALCENRGGMLLFPGKLRFPQTDMLPDGIVGLKLGIRNYVRYNCVPVLPICRKYDFGLGESGAGAIEVVDYAYTGFFYVDGKAVEL